MTLTRARTTSGLEEIFLAHRAQLLRFLKARGAGDAAEDLVQEVWLKVAAAETGPVAQPLPYLYRIANNLMLDRVRAQARSARRDHEWHDIRDAGEDAASLAPSGERVLLAREELARVEQEIASLGDRVATVFRRYRLEGETQRQIAADLGISLSAVEKDLQRAYRLLIEIRRRDDAAS